jgi:hypothetical protein
MKTWLSLCFAVLIAGCASPLPPNAFTSTTPAFDPIKFWTGHTSSWGVIENPDGDPTAILATTTDGTLQTPDRLHMIQHIYRNNDVTTRDWHIRRIAPGQFEATANDVAGTAHGTTAGRTLHWTWILETHPGHPFLNVTMDQRMYLADNGTLLNRTIIRKLGLPLAEISEQFVRRE